MILLITLIGLSIKESGFKGKLVSVDSYFMDFALCIQCISPGGIIMLDDHHWPDVRKIKELCDRHLHKVYESWKVAAYVWEGE